jgi:UDP-glucose 4-epimerase
MSTPRVLVTGGAGFVGSALCARLVHDHYSVSVIDDCRLGSQANWSSEVANEIDLRQADIRDLNAVTDHVRSLQPEIIFHLAAVHFIPTCEAYPTLAVDVNVTGTQSVLEACAKASPDSSIVFTSSAAVYEPSTQAHTETSAIGPTDVYGHTKLFGEQLLALYHLKTGAGVGVARLFNVFGPRETNPHFIPAVLIQAAVAETLQLGNLTTRRDYVFTDDVARALSRLGDVTRAGERLTVNIGAENALSGKEVLDAVAALLGRPLVPTVDSERMRPSDRPLLLSDCAQARERLDWHAVTSFRDGLEKALAQPLAHGVDLSA